MAPRAETGTQGSVPSYEEFLADRPAPSDPGLVARGHAARDALGSRAFVLGHHDQRDEVLDFADVTGGSFKLARDAAHRPDAEFVVCCGSRSMAETADLLTASHQQVVLPGRVAGAPAIGRPAVAEVEQAWEVLEETGVAGNVVPVTAVDSAAAIKAFTGRHSGTICTSSTAKAALAWAFDQRPAERGKVLFLPDQHLGRNIAVRDLGFGLDDCVLYAPDQPLGGLTPRQLRDARMILWPAPGSERDRFSRQDVTDARDRIPGVRVIVHATSRYDVVTAADEVGSSEEIIRAVESAPPGTSWAVGADLHLVRRLARRHPEQRISYLGGVAVGAAATTDRIRLSHLVRTLESLDAGRIPDRVVVDPDDAHWARIALDQMLALPG